jgi:hypothetical protein
MRGAGKGRFHVGTGVLRTSEKLEGYGRRSHVGAFVIRETGAGGRWACSCPVHVLFRVLFRHLLRYLYGGRRVFEW